MAEISVEALVERDALVIGALSEHLLPEIERDFPGMPVCVLTTRCAIEVLRHFGIRARPICVRVAVYNQEFVRRSAREGHLPRDQAELNRWRRESLAEALGVGFPDGKVGPLPRLAGHLVALSHFQDNPQDDGVIIDVGIAQNSRPRRGFVLRPIVFTAPQGFLGGAPFAFNGDNCVFRYEHHPEVRDWATAADWCDPVRREFIVRRTIAKVELKLAAHASDS